MRVDQVRRGRDAHESPAGLCAPTGVMASVTVSLGVDGMGGGAGLGEGGGCDQTEGSLPNKAQLASTASMGIPVVHPRIGRDGPGRIAEDEGTFVGVDVDIASGSPRSESSGVGSAVSANTMGTVESDEADHEAWSPIWAPGSPLPREGDDDGDFADASATQIVFDEFEEFISSEVTVDVEAMRTAAHRGGVSDSVRPQDTLLSRLSLEDGADRSISLSHPFDVSFLSHCFAFNSS